MSIVHPSRTHAKTLDRQHLDVVTMALDDTGLGHLHEAALVGRLPQAQDDRIPGDYVNVCEFVLQGPHHVNSNI